MAFNGVRGHVTTGIFLGGVIDRLVSIKLLANLDIQLAFIGM